MNSFCVYQHLNKKTMLPFYVGCGRLRRAFAKSRSRYWREHAKDGYVVQVLKRGLSQEDALLTEASLIGVYKKCGFAQANVAFAGKCTGLKRSAETRARMSAAQKINKAHLAGKPAWNRGIPATPEQRQKSREVQIGLQAGEKHPMFGKNHTIEARRKISEGKKGKPWSEARRAAQLARRGG